jgi:hypothetical protein
MIPWNGGSEWAIHRRPPWREALWSRDRDAYERGTDTLEQAGQVFAERLGTDGYCKGNKYDKHCVFGGGGTTLITAKAINQIQHR